MKFRRPDGTFDVDGFRHACRVMIIAQEILVDNASYPTKPIEKNSFDYRPLGLGYANLGALLMSTGLAYDSDAGRACAAAVTALMCGEAYRTSAEIAGRMGPFPGYAKNQKPMMRVIRKHRAAVDEIRPDLVPTGLLSAAARAWDEALETGARHGFRNAQVTVLAPTGTIGFMMDCDTTGVEPDIALVKYKKLAGGGMLKIVNQSVTLALRNLDYGEEDVHAIIKHLDERETIEGAPGLKPEHLAVFDCAFKPTQGHRTIHYMGHVRMMGAVQPFLSGAISKTVNMPETVTSEEIAKTFLEAWKIGVKAVAIYRDNSKRTQPLNTGRPGAVAGAGPMKPNRRRLAAERQSLTHKFRVGDHEGYITVGMYEDGTPGEIFIKMAKEGSVVSGLMDSLATATSIALQYGVPLKALVDKFSHTRFEPSGVTGNREIPIAKSIMDYIGRWLAKRFLPPEEQPAFTPSASAATLVEETLRHAAPEGTAREAGSAVPPRTITYDAQPDSPPCPECGSMMTRNGSCYRCVNCGTTSGCS
jgi:ribonucleoside-diphosphate reductase alpha chain